MDMNKVQCFVNLILCICSSWEQNKDIEAFIFVIQNVFLMCLILNGQAYGSSCSKTEGISGSNKINSEWSGNALCYTSFLSLTYNVCPYLLNRSMANQMANGKNKFFCDLIKKFVF